VLAPDGLRTLRGLRVVATSDALDRAGWQGHDVTVLRFAPDEAFGVGADAVAVDDLHAIVEPETGYVGAWLTADALRRHVLPHLDWPLPVPRPALAQGTIAGVPAKIWLTTGPDGADRALLLAQAAYADELRDRLR
jgi:hypothetical protein